jgi:exonuclease VII large subunit
MVLRWKRPTKVDPGSTRVEFRVGSDEPPLRLDGGGEGEERPVRADFALMEGAIRAGAPGGQSPAPTREQVLGWVRAELAVAEERLEYAAAAAEQRLAELVETRAAERFDRVAAVQRQVASTAAHIERRIEERVASAAAEAERRVDEHSARLSEKAEQRLLEADARVRQAERRLSRRARRHELRLARAERDRRLAAAERRLAQRGEALIAELERRSEDAHQHLAALAPEMRPRPERPGGRDFSAPAADRQLEKLEKRLDGRLRRRREAQSARS